MPYDLRQTRARTRGRSGREVSGQYRVAVPDPDALDRLRTQNRVYDRTLTPRDRFTGSVPVGVCSLPGSSRESSTEPMDTDEGAKTTCKIVESVRVAGVGYTLIQRGIHHLPTPLCSLPGAGGKGPD